MGKDPGRAVMARAATEAAERFIEVALVDLAKPVGATPPWTVGDVLGHVATEPGRYRDLALGKGEWPSSAAELPAFNDAQVAALPTRDGPALADMLRRDLREFLEIVDATDGLTMMFDGDQRIRADHAVGTLIGEFLVHGSDIARATGRRWVIKPEHVPCVMTGLNQVLPAWAQPASQTRHTATYEVSLRRGPSYIYQFQEGQLTVDPAGPGRVDARISADPATWLLLSYGRTNPLHAALTGKIWASGRRPWLAPRLSAQFLAA